MLFKTSYINTGVYELYQIKYTYVNLYTHYQFIVYAALEIEAERSYSLYSLNTALVSNTRVQRLIQNLAYMDTRTAF